MRRYLPALGLGLVFYLLFLLISIPATVASQWFAPAQLRLAGVQGSLWNGSAQVVQLEQYQLQQVQWRLQPAGLLRARLHYALKIGEPYRGQGEVARSLFGNITVHDWQGQLPLAPFRQPLFLPSGNLDVKLDNLQWTGEGLPLLQGSAVWQNAGMQTPVVAQFGNIKLDVIDSTHELLTVAVSDLGEGPMKIKGQAQLGADRNLKTDLEIQLTDPSPDNPVAFFLDRTARKLAPGRYQVQYNGRI